MGINTTSAKASYLWHTEIYFFDTNYNFFTEMVLIWSATLKWGRIIKTESKLAIFH
jgi:hypothetical protein